MAKNAFPEFDDATVWVTYPEHLSAQEIRDATNALSQALGDRAPVFGVATRPQTGDEAIGEATRGPLEAVTDIVVYVAKKEIDGAAKILKDEYKADMKAKKSYDDRAERWNRDRDKYFRDH